MLRMTEPTVWNKDRIHFLSFNKTVISFNELQKLFGRISCVSAKNLIETS